MIHRQLRQNSAARAAEAVLTLLPGAVGAGMRASRVPA
jgi:hypothetical protein